MLWGRKLLHVQQKQLCFSADVKAGLLDNKHVKQAVCPPLMLCRQHFVFISIAISSIYSVVCSGETCFHLTTRVISDLNAGLKISSFYGWFALPADTRQLMVEWNPWYRSATPSVQSHNVLEHAICSIWYTCLPLCQMWAWRGDLEFYLICYHTHLYIWNLKLGAGTLWNPQWHPGSHPCCATPGCAAAVGWKLTEVICISPLQMVQARAQNLLTALQIWKKISVSPVILIGYLKF